MRTVQLRPEGETCAQCRAPLASDQRYCLQCGALQGPRRVDPLAGEPDRVDPLPAVALHDPRVPSPRVAALLALAMLVTGIALGAAAGPNAPQTLASAPGQIVAVVSPPAAAATVTPPPPITQAAPIPAPAPAPAPESSDTTSSTPATTTTDDSTTTTPSSGDSTPVTTPAASKLPAVKHIWLIVLADQGYQQLWGTTSSSTYFAKDLRAKGTLLPRYYALGHGPLVDGVALLSGQEPPSQVPTAASLPDQLTGAGLTWKAYLRDVAPGATPTGPTCPAPSTPRDPFVYFRTISTDAVCGTNVVGVDQLAVDLASPDRIPAFSYIAPGEGDLATVQPFVADAITKIMATAAYTKDGLVVITSDQAPETGPYADSRNGGGRVGALVLSPFFTPGTTLVKGRYDHISLLRTIENLFGLEHLGAANDAAHKAFGPPAAA